MGDTPLPVVLVHTGPRIPRGLPSVVEQVRDTTPTRRILLVTDQPTAFDALDVEIVDLSALPPSPESVTFRQLEYSNSTFRSGFWLHAMARLFVLHDTLQCLGIPKAVHVENDVLFLTNPALEERLRDAPPFIYLPFSSRARGVASLVYVGGIEALTDVLRLILNLIESAHLPSEMEYLAAALAAGAPIRPLPTIPSDALMLSEPHPTHQGLVPPDTFWSGFPEFGAIFDATALGHYLAGPDPANDRYISRNLFISVDANIDTPSLMWHIVDNDSQPRLQVSHQGARIDVASLHMHCKSFPPLTTRHLPWYRDRLDAANQQRQITAFEGRRLLEDVVRSPIDLAHFAAQWARLLHS